LRENPKAAAAPRRGSGPGTEEVVGIDWEATTPVTEEMVPPVTFRVVVNVSVVILGL
jgi:hypothetical protein